jgi:flavin reductase (DIM6/NTAB) family NADH-FMN oxidoreductase RutF
MIVHVSGPHQELLARLFGETTGDAVSKFDRYPSTPGPDGAPALAECNWFAGRVSSRVDVGDHVLYLLDVTDEGWADASATGQLGFQRVKQLTAGHEP